MWQIENTPALLIPLLAAAIVLLHLARRRPKTLLVPFLKIWERSEPDRGKGFRNLKNLLLLALSLAALAALTAALARPFRPAPETEHVLLILDDTASMKALDADGVSRFEKARGDMLAAVRSAPPHVSFALGFVAGTPRVAVGFSVDRRAIEEALADAAPSAAGGAASAAVCALSGLAAGKTGAALWVATDSPIASLAGEARPGVSVAARRYGNRSDNMRLGGFSGVWGGWWDSEASLYLRVENEGESRDSCVLKVRADEETILEKPLTLEPGGAFETVLPVQRPDKPVLFEGGIEPGGALGIDDKAWCLVPGRVRKRVLLVSPSPGPFLWAALKGLEDDVDQAASALSDPSKWRAAFREGDLCVFEGAGPGDSFPEGGFIAIDPDPALMPRGDVAAEEVGNAAVSDWDRSHLLTRGLSFENVFFRKFRPLCPAYHPLVTTDKGVVIGARETAEGASVVISARFSEGNLGVVSSFPLLVRNAVRWVGGSGSASAGEEARQCSYVDPADHGGEDEVRLYGERGGPGIAVTGGARVVYNFFNREESVLSGSRIEGGPWPVPPRRPPEARPWKLFAAAALALLLLDWIAYTLLARRRGSAAARP